MEQILIGFYALFFATGFMGVAALYLLDLRLRSQILKLFLLVQFLFLIAMGLILVYLYLQSLTLPDAARIETTIIVMVEGLNIALFAVLIRIINLVRPESRGKKPRVDIWVIAAWCGAAGVMVMSFIAVLSGLAGGFPFAVAPAWLLTNRIIYTAAMLLFGAALVRPQVSPKPVSLRELVRAYGVCAIVFAPAGILEWLFGTLEIPGIADLSLDHFFFLAWNLISMSAAIRLIRPGDDSSRLLEEVPKERIESLGLSAREVEMALMIAKGMTNKEIAAALFISPATVRTHIYNLYRKAGARSRVELINTLTS